MAKAKRYTISDIRHANHNAGNYFFTRDTLKFHKDRVRNWGVVHRDSPDPERPSHFPHRVFIRHKIKDEVREFFPDTGAIGVPLDRHERDALNL